MEYAAPQGYPVPEIHELRSADTEIVMERIPGPLMSDAILQRIWTLPRAAKTLADLHDQLHDIAGPEWLRQMPDGGAALVHLDLHPLNVIMHPERGPVVIDWANASRGDGLFDVGVTYVLLTCPTMPGPAALRVAAKPIRALLAREFTKRYRGRALDAPHRRSRRDEDPRRPHGARRDRRHAAPRGPQTKARLTTKSLLIASGRGTRRIFASDDTSLGQRVSADRRGARAAGERPEELRQPHAAQPPHGAADPTIDMWGQIRP